MTLKRMEASCVTTTCTEEWLESLHSDTADEALAVMGDARVEAELVLLAKPCWYVLCDGCGADLEDDGLRRAALAAKRGKRLTHMENVREPALECVERRCLPATMNPELRKLLEVTIPDAPEGGEMVEALLWTTSS